MSVLRYAVVQCGPEWKVVGARRAMGHFADQNAAAAAGARLALQACAAGHSVEFLVQDEVGELKPQDPGLLAAMAV